MCVLAKNEKGKELSHTQEKASDVCASETPKVLTIHLSFPQRTSMDQRARVQRWNTAAESVGEIAGGFGEKH